MRHSSFESATTRAVGGVLLAALSVAACAAGAVTVAGQERDELAPADLDTFEPSIKQRIVEALERAAGEPTGETIGELGLLLHAYDRFDRAAACYARARQLAPRAFEWPYYQGVALAMAGDIDRAAAALEEALQLSPADVPARLRLADLQLEQGRLDASARSYRGVLRDRPGSAVAHYGLARALAARGGREAVPPDALRHYERAAALAPAFGAAHYALALAYRRLGDRSRAEASLARYHETRGQPAPLDDPLVARVATLRSGPYEDLARGRWLRDQGRHREAVEALARAARTSPTLVQAHVNLIAAYAAVGAADEAEAAYRAATALNPDLPEAHYNLGVLRLSQSREDEAIAAFERAVASNASHAGAHNNLGFVLAQRGRAGEAADHFRAALAANPAHRDAHFNLARLLLAERNNGEALAHFAEAAEIEDEKTSQYLYYLADACARSGRMADAERHALAARTRAVAHGQASLVERIDNDLRRLRERSGARQ
ncbi:MAG: tetratricopeptide repeat protein [Luteitalea sp.]|nr:tetratricopeptide repeat protein [Luteitalea sp.]